MEGRGAKRSKHPSHPNHASRVSFHACFALGVPSPAPPCPKSKARRQTIGARSGGLRVCVPKPRAHGADLTGP